jgi:uncharacterized protein (UPF0332 family)
MEKFRWTDYLELARELVSSEVSPQLREARFRTAVSRAYYAAFCSLREYASDRLGFSAANTGEDHTGLVNFLGRLGSPWFSIAQDLSRLRKWRNRCDYEAKLVRKDMSRNALRRAARILRQLS